MADGSTSLKCACCQRSVPLEMIKLLTDDKNQAQKFVFNPLTFHYAFCFFSPQYKHLTGKMDALDVLRETVVLNKGWTAVASSNKEATLPSLRLINLKFMRQRQVLHDQIISNLRKKYAGREEQLEEELQGASSVAEGDAAQEMDHGLLQRK